MILNKFKNFIRESKEQDEINRLLDLMTERPLSKDEKDLLNRLSRGEKLPSQKTKLATNKIGNIIIDDTGKVVTEKDPNEAGKEFITSKGKQKKLFNVEEIASRDFRVYRNKDSEERFIFAYIAEDNNWTIYRTGTESKYPLGIFAITESFKNKTPQVMWKENDMDFDYGMILEDQQCIDFLELVSLYNRINDKNRLLDFMFKKDKNRLLELRSKFMNLL